MTETSDIQSCERAGDLIGYLYGEATEKQAQDFNGHLLVCGACRAELGAFGTVREAIGLWREQALSSAQPFVAEIDLVPARQLRNPEPKRSAFAFVRELFQMSPMWMRGSAALATLLLAAFLVIGLMSFFNRTESPVVKQESQRLPTQPDEVISTDKLDEPEVRTPLTARDADQSQPRGIKQRKNRAVGLRPSGNGIAANNQIRQPKAPSLSPEERTQLAELWISDNDYEDSVPRLYDLLTESN